MFLITYPCYYNLVAKYIPININIFRLHCKCIPCMLFSLLDLKLFSILPHKIPILRYRNKIENLVSFYYTGTCLDFFKSVVLDTFERSSWAKQSQHKNEGILSSLIWPCWARRSWPSNRKALVLCGLRSGWWDCWNKLGWARGNGSKDSPVRRTAEQSSPRVEPLALPVLINWFTRWHGCLVPPLLENALSTLTCISHLWFEPQVAQPVCYGINS